MKKLNDFKEEIYKCSRCGLCQSVCPVYKATLNECSVSKAKFTMLNGIIKGDLRLNAKIKSYMDLCTGCNACKEFCPSGIDAKKIFQAVKEQYYREHKLSFFEKIVNSYLIFKLLLNIAKFSFFFYRLLRFDKLIKMFTPLIRKFGILGKRFLLMDKLINQHTVKNVQTVNFQKHKKAVFFKGCFNQYLNSESEEAVKKILKISDIELIEKDFECCGVSYLSDGLVEEFLKLANKNVSNASKVDFDYIITDCASCLSTLKEYQNYIDTKQTKIFSEKVVGVVDLIKCLNFRAKKPVTVTVHKPCHDDYTFIDIVKNIENVRYVEAVDYDKCCGFSGKFALKNSEISRKISDTKAQHFYATNADYILTTCPACVLGLNQGLIEADESLRLSQETCSPPEVMNLFVFLAEYCEII